MTYTLKSVLKKLIRLDLFKDTASQNGNLNILLNCIFQPIWVHIIRAQWLKYRICDAEDRNSLGAMFIFTELKF